MSRFRFCSMSFQELGYLAAHAAILPHPVLVCCPGSSGIGSSYSWLLKSFFKTALSPPSGNSVSPTSVLGDLVQGSKTPHQSTPRISYHNHTCYFRLLLAEISMLRGTHKPRRKSSVAHQASTKKFRGYYTPQYTVHIVRVMFLINAIIVQTIHVLLC